MIRLTRLDSFSAIIFLLIIILVVKLGGCRGSNNDTVDEDTGDPSPSIELPYDRSNPVIYDNDEVVDVYTDDYLMALASVGDINLVGMITSSSIKPFNRFVTQEDYERMLSDRSKGVGHARNSGFINIPDPVQGPQGHLQKPASGKIEDTQPIGSDGSWLIVNAARKATPEKPLVMVMGGTLTVVADAYLLDNSIADKLIVAWAGGRENDMGDYNGWADSWAAFIVLQELRLVQFPSTITYNLGAPDVPKSRLTSLPNTELRQWMIKKDHPVNTLPAERDADAPPAISLMRPDFIVGMKRVSFNRMINVDHWGAHEVPAFEEDSNGNAMVAITFNKDVATDEWWRALKNLAAYGR